MELDEIIVSYFNNPTVELKNKIMEKASKTSRMAIIHSISNIPNLMQINEENKNIYIEVSEMLLNEIKREEVKNYRLDEDGYFREVEESKKGKLS